jgi:hypothetical protein
MVKLNFREKKYLESISFDTQNLRNNWHRRLRNALIALASMDPAWMMWVERHVPAVCDIRITARLVEVRARTLLMRSYSHYGESAARSIIDGNRPFGDDGTLLAG